VGHGFSSFLDAGGVGDIVISFVDHLLSYGATSTLLLVLVANLLLIEEVLLLLDALYEYVSLLANDVEGVVHEHCTEVFRLIPKVD
jgi:uncharacterized phosphosugar-binding protein